MINNQIWVKRTALVSLGVAFVLGVGRLFAAGADSDPGDKLEEILVTAQRRAENLQNVPISVQVIDSQRLTEQNHNSMEELTQTVPGVHVASGIESNDLFIRGIGSGRNPSFDQSVAMFTDDIYHGRSRVSGATFLDLDRIEILKGPQSTFFGNNAIAGALNIVTKKPGDALDASARLLYGRFGEYAAEGAIGGPISATFGARLAVIRNGTADGWIRNVNTGESAPKINDRAVRLTLLFNPTEYLDATLKGEASRQNVSGSADQFGNCPPPAPLTPDFQGSFCAQALALGLPTGTANNVNSGLAGQGKKLSTFETVLTINFHQWGQTFTSVSGVNNYHYNSNNDSAKTGTYLLTYQWPESYHQFSQELRVASAAGRPIEYMAGAYFQNDRYNSNAVSNSAFINPIVTAYLPALAPYEPLAFEPAFSQGEHVYSVFGSLGWNIVDRLKATAGLRGSWNNKDVVGGLLAGTGTQTYGGFVQLPPDIVPVADQLLGGTFNERVSLKQSAHAWMPSAGIQYQIVPEMMVYFSYSKGFKAGGVNGQALPASPVIGLVPEYGPEHVQAYELGLKSKWMDDTLLLNLDVFRSDYRDLQVQSQAFIPALNSYTPFVLNAAKSRSQGVEFETQWAVSKEFRVLANVTYLDSYYVSFPNAPPTVLQQFCAGDYALPYCSVYPQPVPPLADLAGQQTAFAPRWSGNVTARYTLLLPSDYNFATELNPYATSSYFASGGSGDLFSRAGGYVRLDGRLTLTSPRDHWAVDLIGKNLTNRIIVTSPSFGFVSKEEPRNVAVQFRYHW